MFRLIVVAFVVLRTVDCFGDTLTRNPAVMFLSARSGWRVYDANALTVNPNLSIAPTSVSPNANQRAVIVDFGNGQEPVLGLATVGAFAGSTTNKRTGVHKNKPYDLDSIVISPVPVVNSTTNQTAVVTATPITLTLLPIHGASNQCVVARINMQGSNNIDGGAGSTCAIFVRNSTDTSLLDVREIRKCELGLRKCSRSLRRLGRHDPLVELTTLEP